MTIHGELGTLWLTKLKSRWRSLGSEGAWQGLGDSDGAGQRVSVGLVEDIVRSGDSLGQGSSSIRGHHLGPRHELGSSGPQLVGVLDEVRVEGVELLDVGQVPGGILLLLELHEAGSPPAAHLAVSVERTVALGVSVVSGDPAVRTLVVSEDWTRDASVGILQHVIPEHHVTLPVGEAEAAQVHGYKVKSVSFQVAINEEDLLWVQCGS